MDSRRKGESGRITRQSGTACTHAQVHTRVHTNGVLIIATVPPVYSLCNLNTIINYKEWEVI